MKQALCNLKSVGKKTQNKRANCHRKYSCVAKLTLGDLAKPGPIIYDFLSAMYYLKGWRTESTVIVPFLIHIAFILSIKLINKTYIIQRYP